MEKNKAISPFQIVDWRILSFNCVNPIFAIPVDIEHNWTIKAHIEKIDSDEDCFRGAVQIDFHFSAIHEGQEMFMQGQCVALCEMKKNAMPEAETVFPNLLSRTAMTNCLANLRVFLLQAGTLHQMGVKRIMLPFINLNHFTFDEEVKFTT